LSKDYLKKRNCMTWLKGNDRVKYRGNRRETMDQVLDFMKGFNIQTILSLAGIVWFFSSSLKSEMKLLEAKIDQQSNRSDRLYEMFIELVRDKKGG